MAADHEGFMHLERKLQQHDERFDRIDERFDRIDKRFDQHDERFDRIDKRFDQHDERFDRIAKRFDQHDERFDQHDERFHRVELKLEKIEDDLKLVLEVMHTGFESLRRDLQTQIDDLKARLSLVEEIVRQNNREIIYGLTAIQEIGRTVQRNTAAIDEHTREFRDLRAALERIDAKLDEQAARAEVEAIEHRVAALEAEVLGRKS